MISSFYAKQPRLMNSRAALLVLLSSVSLAACGGGGGGSTPAAPTPPSPPPPPTNAAPVFTGNVSVAADENAIATIPASITDPDGDALTFSLSGADAALFTFDESAAAITSNAPFDNAGVVRVINATTGDVVQTFAGDQQSDSIGARIRALETGGFLLGSPNDDFNDLENAGSAMLVTAQ